MEENTELEVDSQNTSEENPQEYNDTQEDIQTEDQTSQKGDAKYSENEKQLYERAKRAEAKAKRLEHLEKKVEETPNTPIEEVAKTVHALKDYSAEEVETIFRQAKVLNVSPLEAIKNEDVALLIEAKRAKVARENKTPEPTNRQGTEEREYSQWTQQDIENASMDNLSKYYDYLKKQK